MSDALAKELLGMAKVEFDFWQRQEQALRESVAKLEVRKKQLDSGKQIIVPLHIRPA